jgi:pimeloyl-ACP methyl ester carboxylesterase
VRIVAVSMGSYLAQELMVARPELVTAAVLMATRGREDKMRAFGRNAERELLDAGIQLPPTYDAKLRLLENFSPATLNNDKVVRDWMDMFTMWPTKVTPGLRAQLDVAPSDNRLPAYRSITAPTLVIGFADDLLLPPYLGREVADAIPQGRYLQIPDAGHLGFIERPDAVNAAALEFFGSGV